MDVVAFVGKIVNILAVFPQGHALIVMSPVIVGAYIMRITDEKRAYLVLNNDIMNTGGVQVDKRGIPTTQSPTTSYAYPGRWHLFLCQ